MQPVDRGTLITRLASELAGESDVVAAYLFGSTARGQAQGVGSDVDIGVLFTDTPPTVERLFRRVEIARLLEAALEVAVDVVDLRAAPPTSTIR